MIRGAKPEGRRTIKVMLFFHSGSALCCKGGDEKFMVQ